MDLKITIKYLCTAKEISLITKRKVNTMVYTYT